MTNPAEAYHAYLAARIQAREVDAGWWTIDAPYLNRHNDYLQVFIRDDPAGYFITDESETISDLAMTGCNVRRSKRLKAMAQQILRAHGLGEGLIDGGEICVTVSREKFAAKLHSMFLVMLGIDGLSFAARG